MSLSRQENTDLVTLIVGMFSAAPGANNLKSFYTSLANDGYTLKSLAIDLGNTEIFKSLYSDSLANTDFSTKFINNLVGTSAQQNNIDWAINWMSSLLDAGTSRGEAVYTAITALSKISHSDPNWGNTAATLNNKQLSAQDYSIYQGKSGANLAELQAPIANVTSDNSTLSKNAGKFWIGQSESTFGSTNGNDTITGTNDDEDINGLAGDDIINALEGEDDVRPGDGNDTITFLEMGDNLNYDDVSAAVTVNLALGTTQGTNKNDTFTTTVTSVEGSEYDDTLIGGNSAADSWESFIGGRGSDTIDGGSGHDELRYEKDYGFGISANFATGKVTDSYGDIDSITNIEAIRGTRLDDTVIAGSQEYLNFRGHAGNDTFQGTVYNATTDTGYETMDYSKDAKTKDEQGEYATKGIKVDLSNNTATDGYGDTDTLINIDRIKATEFDDILKGDGQNNRFDGGDGNDTFIFVDNWGNDRISDFSRGNDKIDLTGSSIKFSDLVIVTKGGDTTVTANESSIKLSGVSTIDSTDFLFS